MVYIVKHFIILATKSTFMYQAHQLFKEPGKDSTKIWRYMDFTKFISLLDTKSLYFTRADKFDDPFEGSFPRKNILARKAPPFGAPYVAGSPAASFEYKVWPRYMAVNCWHENEQESAAMWKLYLKSNEGIAILSTFGRLKKGIRDPQEVYIGKVNYIDYDRGLLDPSNIFTPFLHKRKSFEHERELRAIISKWPASDSYGGMDFTKETIEDGIAVKFNLRTLIHSIYVAPNSPVWFLELVKSMVATYGYNFKVIQSHMDKSPMF